MRSHRASVVVGALAVTVALMLAYVWEGWRGKMLAAELSRLQTEQRRLLDERDQLRARIVALSRVERIKVLATNRIGLVDPALPPVDVPAVAPMGSADSLDAIRASGMEQVQGRTE